MSRWSSRPVLVLLLAAGARAQEPAADKVQATLAAIDAILGPTGAKRVEVKPPAPRGMGRALCGGGADEEPGKANRDFLCDRSAFVGHWRLDRLRADGGSRVGADLEVRRFSSPEDARAAKATALERYGGRTVSHLEGSISWCYLDVLWTEDLLFSLWYHCAISLGHVKALKAVRAELLKLGVPFDDSGTIGVWGSHGGWSGLFLEEGKTPPLADQVRFRHFVRVVDVAANDVLWLRGRPSSGELGARVDKIPPTASCLPLVFAPPSGGDKDVQGWVRVKFNGHEAWARRRFLADQPAEECRQPR